ncbi:MAG TPA: hypothetical protein PLH94_12525 [Fimbriimonadaceae bacterium]|nr:hypothetical protein [Fimbriimonadaceae bacterium]
MRTVLAILVLSLAAFSFSQREVRVELKSGTKSFEGSIKGRDYADYVVKAGAGQSLAVSLSAQGARPFFNVLPPGSQGEAMHNGSEFGSKMPARRLPSDGEYRVRVYLLGAAQSEGKTSRFRLTLTLSGKALPARTGASDKKIPGTPYHAQGPVPVRIELEPDRKSGEGAVIRRVGNGNATVDLRSGRLVRRVLFVGGKPVASDSREVMKVSRKGDVTVIRFGDRPSEEYSVPDAMIFGG